jgi:hypothetical protein
MDECRFDNWTRLLAGLRDRRTALRDLTGAGLALVSLARADLGLAADDDVLVEGCRLSGDECDRNSQCCSDICKRSKRRRKNRRDDGNNRRRRDRRRGECRCLGSGKSCNRDAACCRGFCDRSDNRCRCTPQGETCNRDQDCCKGTCRTDNQGNRFCSRNRRRRRRN